MDTSQLVTIAVTAIITAFVKEIVGWFVSIVKNFASSTTIRTKIKTALTVNKVTAIVNLTLIGFCSWRVYYYVTLPYTLDGFSVFNIAYFTCAAFANLLRLEIQTAMFAERLRREKDQRAQIEHEMNLKHIAQLQPLGEALKKLNEKINEPFPESRPKALPDKLPDE